MKILLYILSFILTATLLFLCYISYFIFYPIEYFESQQPYKILNENKTVRVGENLIYEVKYCKHADYIPQRVVRTLVDGFAYDLPISSTGNFKKGCHTTNVIVPMVVPASIPTDHEYHINIAIDYKLNPFRTESRTFETENFKLIK